MSTHNIKLTRYDHDAYEAEDGEWVFFVDVAPLLAELEAARKVIEDAWAFMCANVANRDLTREMRDTYTAYRESMKIYLALTGEQK